jgi:hypothetical protein
MIRPTVAALEMSRSNIATWPRSDLRRRAGRLIVGAAVKRAVGLVPWHFQ